MYSRRFDLQGVVFRAAVRESFGTEVIRGENNKVTIKGLMYDVWHMLETRNNFTTEYAEVRDGSAGVRAHATGEWTGLVGALTRREADVAVSLLAMTPERRALLPFPFPLLMLRYKVFVRAPSSGVGWRKVTAPFDGSLWAAVGASVLATAACLALALAHAHAAAPPRDAAFAALYAFEMQASAFAAPRAGAARLVLVTAFVTAMVVAASYSATLVASLAVADARPPFRSLRELLADGSYAAGLVDQTSQHAYFKYPNRESARLVYERLMAPDAGNLVRDDREGFARACARRYAFFATSPSARRAFAAANCSLLALDIDIAAAAASFAFAPDSTFFKFINYNLQRMANFGILSRVQKQALFERSGAGAGAAAGGGPAFAAVTLEDVAPMFAALAAGCALSLLFLSAEVFLPRALGARSRRSRASKHRLRTALPVVVGRVES